MQFSTLKGFGSRAAASVALEAVFLALLLVFISYAFISDLACLLHVMTAGLLKMHGLVLCSLLRFS